MFKTQILQKTPHLVIFSDEEDTLIESKGKQDTQINADCHGGRAFFDTHNGQLAATRAFGYLRNTQVPTQTRQTNLLPYNP
jgi:hypothetical protein